MANIFQPNLESEARFENPVEQPSVLGSIFEAASNLVQGLGTRSGGGSDGKAVQDAQNLALFSSQVEKIQKVREEKGEAAAAVLERQLAANFASTGQEFDDDYKAVYQTQTGRPWDYYSRDLETRVQQDYLFKDEKFQAGMVASYALPESADLSEEDRLQWASQYVAEQNAADVLLQRSMKNGQVQWSTGTAAAYETKRQAVTETTWGALSQVIQSGQVISQEDFVQARASWDNFKTTMPRPEGATDDQWVAEQSARDLVDAAFKNIESNIGSPELTKRMLEDVQRAGLEAGINKLAILSVTEDFESFRNSTVDAVTDMFKLNKLSPTSNLRVSDIYNTGKVGGTEAITVAELPPDLKKIAESKNPEEIWSAADGSAVLIKGSVTDLERPSFRKQFVDRSMTLGASMMHNLDGEYLSKDFIQSSIGSPAFIANIKRLSQIDSAAGGAVRTVLRAGINSEIVRQNAVISQIEWNNSVKWDGFTYVFDSESYKSKHPSASDATVKGAEENFNRRLASRAQAGVDAAFTEAANLRQSVALLEDTSIKLNSEVVTDTSTIDSSKNVFNPGSVTATLLDKYEGGGSYDTLFKFSEREGGEFAGTKVSEMTIGELKAFSNGPYGAWSTRQLGYKATPMGRFQFVGDTLASTAAKMGLGDNVVFTPEVQNSMFVFLAKEVMAGKSQEGKRAALRSTWEGLKKAGPAALDAMIAEIEDGRVVFGDTLQTRENFTGGAGIEQVLPQEESSTPVFQSTRSGSTAAPTSPLPAEAITLPGDVVSQSTASPGGSQRLIPSEVAALVSMMGTEASSKEELVKQILEYLEGLNAEGTN